MVLEVVKYLAQKYLIIHRLYLDFWLHLGCWNFQISIIKMFHDTRLLKLSNMMIYRVLLDSAGEILKYWAALYGSAD